MHAVGARSFVTEDDFERVAHFAAQNRAENAEILFIWRPDFLRRKCVVGEFAVDDFFVDAPDAMVGRLHVWLLGFVERHAHGLVAARRRVIPIQFHSGDVVGARLAIEFG